MSDNKRIVKNSFFLYGRMLFSILIAFYSVRFVLNNLGIEDYGIYNVIGGVIAMLSFFNSAMISSTQRHLSYEMGKGSEKDVKKIFNASLRIHLGIALLVVLIGESLGPFLIKNVLEIPAKRLVASLWVYQCVIFILFFDILSLPFQAITIAKEHMQVIAVRDIFSSIGRLLIAVVLGYVFTDRLILYGLLLLSLNFFVCFSFYWYCRKHYQDCQILKDRYDISLYKELLGFAGWTLFGALAAMSRIQGNSLILNVFYGPKMNAAFGISNQISSQAQSVSNVFLQASNPQIIKNFSSGDKEKAFKLANFISRFSFYVLFSFCLPILLNIDFVLQFWLKNVPEFSAIFCQLMIVNFLIGVLCNPIITLIQATGRIRNFQIINSFVFLLNIPISYILLKLNFPPYTIVYGLIVSTFMGNIVKLYFIQFLDNFSIKNWLREVLFRVILVTVFAVVLSFLFLLLFPATTGFINFLFSSSIFFFITIVIIALFGIRRDEKIFIMNFLKAKVKAKKI